MPSFNTRFDDSDVKIDQVVLAVAPIDAFTGEYVKAGLEVRLVGLPDLPRRNLSGMYVFVNLPARNKYLIHIQAQDAGYFDPETIEFTPVPDTASEIGKKRRVNVALHRRPTAPQAIEASAIAGVLVRPQGHAQIPVTLASVRVEFPSDLLPPGTGASPSFRTFSDERGAFLLSLRLPSDNGEEAIPVSIIFEKIEGTQVDKRVIERRLKNQTFYSFDKPVDIEGVDIPLGLNDAALPELIQVMK